MKLSKLYSNKSNIFPQINFREGFNVIFALIKDPRELNKDSHNLGKTFLANLIDFCLLADIDKDHPFKKRTDLFGDFIFFLEIKLSSSSYITIRRKVTGRKGICIQTSSKTMDLLPAPEERWEYASLGLKESVSLLNDLLNFKIIDPYDYRKGITYFLRRQADYNDVFQIQKFSIGKHVDWKPYMAHILGLKRELVKEKYEIDEEINIQEGEKTRLSTKTSIRSQKYDEIKGLIDIKKSTVEKMRKQLDNFSFYDIETNISEDIVHRIESLISSYNEKRYLLEYKLQEVENSLNINLVIDSNKMFHIFEEVNLIMPDSLKKKYDELVEFNKRISIDRVKRLNQLRKSLIEQKNDIENALNKLDNERQRALNLLTEKITFQKYKNFQKSLLLLEEEILSLQNQLQQLDEISIVNRKIQTLKSQRSLVINNLEQSLKEDNPVYSNIRKTFAQYVEEILNVPASLFTEINTSGNLDFKTRIIDIQVGQETFQSRGTSYKKVLCACFDLAILTTYHGVNFFHFVYHDGVFEGLDNRKKVKLLTLVRRLCKEYGIQYVLTVIDSDLPRDESDSKLLFSETEIIRQLNDGGDEGRLFKMPIF